MSRPTLTLPLTRGRIFRPTYRRTTTRRATRLWTTMKKKTTPTGMVSKSFEHFRASKRSGTPSAISCSCSTLPMASILIPSTSEVSFGIKSAKQASSTQSSKVSPRITVFCLVSADSYQATTSPVSFSTDRPAVSAALQSTSWYASTASSVSRLSRTLSKATSLATTATARPGTSALPSTPTMFPEAANTYPAKQKLPCGTELFPATNTLA